MACGSCSAGDGVDEEAALTEVVSSALFTHTSESVPMGEIVETTMNYEALLELAHEGSTRRPQY